MQRSWKNHKRWRIWPGIPISSKKWINCCRLSRKCTYCNYRSPVKEKFCFTCLNFTSHLWFSWRWLRFEYCRQKWQIARKCGPIWKSAWNLEICQNKERMSTVLQTISQKILVARAYPINSWRKKALHMQGKVLQSCIRFWIEIEKTQFVLSKKNKI